MADYFTPTVIQQTIPAADITPLERLLLTRIFSAEPDGDGLYFYSEEGLDSMIFIERTKLESALAQSRDAGSSVAATCVAKALAELAADEDEAEIELDVSGISWEDILQDVLRRSSSLRYISAISSFTCSKMRPDAFGGTAVVITSDKILAKSTDDLVREFLAEAGISP